ncbi:MAG TPA: hypothetical protein VEH04_16750 [Verrucomicrobiae bacterium]|nr:hypothetical protein [Verrucomicrobiae bacterium]
MATSYTPKSGPEAEARMRAKSSYPEAKRTSPKTSPLSGWEWLGALLAVLGFIFVLVRYR